MKPRRDIFAEIAEVAGEAAAVALIAQYGGTKVYVPARISARHWLVECVGRPAAEKICAHFATSAAGSRRGCQVELPLGNAGAYRQLRRRINRLIHQRLTEGRSENEIAAEVRVTTRTVRHHRAVHRGQSGGSRCGAKNRRQGSLF